MENCIFCKIIAGELPAEKIYEDEETLAFLDIKPVNPGHTLVVSKVHYRNVFDLPESVWLSVMKTVHKVVHAVKEGVGAEGVNINSSNEPAAGQEVFHLHIHIIPRKTGDPHKPLVGKEYKEGEKAIIAEKIKTALQS